MSWTLMCSLCRRRFKTSLNAHHVIVLILGSICVFCVHRFLLHVDEFFVKDDPLPLTLLQTSINELSEDLNPTEILHVPATHSSKTVLKPELIPEQRIKSVTKSNTSHINLRTVAIAVHTSRLDRYLAVKKVLSLQKTSHLCHNGDIAVFHPIFFSNKCKDCPIDLPKLTKQNSFYRSLEMLTKASKLTNSDMVFKMDDDTFLNVGALSRRVCALKSHRSHYYGFLMHADRLFASGGAGYLISSSLLHDMKISLCAGHEYEDVGLAHCIWTIARISPSHLDVNPDTPEQMLMWSKTPSSDHRSKATFRDAVSFHYIPASRQNMMLLQRNMFPKKIHQFWLGRRPPPWSKLQSCRDLHPDWEVKLWTEEELKNIQYDSKYQAQGSFIRKLVSSNFFDRDSTLKQVDLLKIEILYRFGGFAMDADQICIRKLDPLLSLGLNSDYVAAHEHNHAHSNVKSLIANGVQISHQYSSTVLQLLIKIPTLMNGGPAWQTTGPCLVSQGIAFACGRNPTLLRKTETICSGYFGSIVRCSPHDMRNITLLDSDVFFPYHHSEKDKMASCSKDLSRSFTIQYWSSTSEGYHREKKVSDIGSKRWRLDEKAAVYYGPWDPGKCFNGLREHPIARSVNSSVHYALSVAIPAGSILNLSTEANVDLGSGVSLWKHKQLTSKVTSIRVMGSSPIIIVYTPSQVSGQNNDELTGLDKSHMQKWRIEMVSVQSLDIKHRFDIIVKTAYALCMKMGLESDFVTQMYKRHLHVWNNFKEPCSFFGDKDWFDSTNSCQSKSTSTDFVQSFKNTFESISLHGFDSKKSAPPVTVSNFALNGAHRIAAAFALGLETIPMQRILSSRSANWGYKFFSSRGFEIRYADFAMLQWVSHTRNVTTVLFWPEAIIQEGKMSAAQNMVDNLCGPVVYEKMIDVNKNGISTLARHSYGDQVWIESKIEELQSVFPDDSTKLQILVLFVAPKSPQHLKMCKKKIRSYFNLKNSKSAMHIPDYHEEAVIIAQAVLNSNSILLLNSKESRQCQFVASQLGSRLALKPVNPFLYLLPGDIMIDSGAVMSFFGLRTRTDVDILFRGAIDRTLIGTQNGVLLQAHEFKHNRLNKNARAWGAEHISDCSVDDLFTDPQYYGFCFGVKYVSLQQLISYKKKRGEIGKDEADVKRVQDYLRIVSAGGTLADSIKPISITQGYHDAETKTMKKISKSLNTQDGVILRP